MLDMLYNKIEVAFDPPRFQLSLFRKTSTETGN